MHVQGEYVAPDRVRNLELGTAASALDIVNISAKVASVRNERRNASKEKKLTDGR